MILLSSHLDRVRQEFPLAFVKNAHVGLLDNFVGVLVTYLALYDDPNLLKMEWAGKVRIWHNRAEEWGRLSERGFRIRKTDVVVVIDVAAGDNYKGLDFAVENIWGIPKRRLNELKKDLEWEQFRIKWKTWEKDPDFQDEAWQWKKKGIPAMSFIVPIVGSSPGDNWHGTESRVDAQHVIIAKEGLKRLISGLADWYAR